LQPLSSALGVVPIGFIGTLKKENQAKGCSNRVHWNIEKGKPALAMFQEVRLEHRKEENQP